MEYQFTKDAAHNKCEELVQKSLIIG
jgi:hypothetical protein